MNGENGEQDVSYDQVAEAYGGLFTASEPGSEVFGPHAWEAYPDVYAPPSDPVDASGDVSGFFGDLFRGVGRVAEAAATSVARSAGGILTASLFPQAPRPAGPVFAPGQPMMVQSRSPAGYPGSGGGGPGFLPSMGTPGTTNPLGFLMSPWVIIGLMGAVFVMLIMRRN